jgi:hypothetical protein
LEQVPGRIAGRLLSRRPAPAQSQSGERCRYSQVPLVHSY